MQIEIRSGKKARRIRELFGLWLINSLGLLLVSKSIKGIEFSSSGWQQAATIFAAAALLGLINVALKPILLVLTLPINILSLGLFTLLINGACLGLVSWAVPGFEIASLWSAVLGALLLSLISMLLNAVLLAGGFKVRIQR
jgi:putative membrane protein